MGIWKVYGTRLAFKLQHISVRFSSVKSKRTFKFKDGKEAGSKLSFGDYAMLVFPAATLCLGIWQTGRRTWKLNLIAELEEKTNAEPVALPDNFSDLENMEYRRVFVRGRFDHSKEMFIGPRSFISNDANDAGGGLIGNPNTIGWHVVTPFALEGKNEMILINRGWVPKNKKNPESRLAGQINETVELTGVVRKEQIREQFTPKNIDSSFEVWNYRNIHEMASKSGCQEVFLDADKHSTVPGGPIGGQTKISLRNEHLSYMFTWYSLSGAMLYLWWRRFIR